MILYTADSHISHKNIIHYAKRPFHDVHEMDVAIITQLRKAESMSPNATIVHADAVGRRAARDGRGAVSLP